MRKRGDILPGDDGQGGISHLLSFVDDISSCVYLPDFDFLCEQVRSRGASIGCFVNPHKTRVLTSCNGTSILSTLTIHNPLLAQSLSTSIASFSTTPHPTGKSAPDIPVELITGFRLLGQPIGSATFASEFFHRHIDDIKKKIFPTRQYLRPTNPPPSLLPVHYTKITTSPLCGCPLSLTY
jgi:hypothetical protein